MGRLTLAIAAVMAVFTILFGTRHLDAAERHEGMVAAVAFESVVKLVAFLAVGLFVTYGLFDGFGDVFGRAAASPELAKLLTLDPARSGNWLALPSSCPVWPSCCCRASSRSPWWRTSMKVICGERSGFSPRTSS